MTDYEWWDGAQAYLDRAGIERWEVIGVLYSPGRWPRLARTRERLSMLTVWGRTDEGRPLVVMLRHPTDVRMWQILMAAPMRPQQLEEFTAWEAQQ